MRGAARGGLKCSAQGRGPDRPVGRPDNSVESRRERVDNIDMTHELQIPARASAAQPPAATREPFRSRSAAAARPSRIRMVETYTCPCCANATNLRRCMGTIGDPHPEQVVATRPTLAIPAADVVCALDRLAAEVGGEAQAGLNALAERIRTDACAQHYPLSECRKTRPNVATGPDGRVSVPA